MGNTVLIERDKHFAMVTLNRPNKRNAISQQLALELTEAFCTLHKDNDIAAVILTGAGKAFCAGMDLEDLSRLGGEFRLSGEYDIRAAMEAFDRPIIGAINGPTATGGFELALQCDLLIAAETAKFADTHARVGVLPGWGLSQKLPRVIGMFRAREMSLTGNYITAQQAADWGLVSRVVSSETLLNVCKGLAEDMAGCDRQTLIAYKDLINKGITMDLGASLEYEYTVSDLYARSKTAETFSSAKQGVIERGRDATK